MSELTLISFVDPGGGGYGLAALAPGRSDALVGGETAISAHADAPRDDEDAVQLSDDGSTIALHWSSAGDSFRIGIDERAVGVRPVEVGVDASGSAGEASFNGVGIAWDLSGAGDDIGAARTLWMALESNRLLLLCAIRPAGAEHHDEEQLLAVQIGSDGEVTSYADPLLSTEYDKGGAHTRATLELWTDQEGQPADRGGGLRTIGAAMPAGEARIEAARFDWRLNGIAGIGAYEIVTV